MHGVVSSAPFAARIEPQVLFIATRCAKIPDARGLVRFHRRGRHGKIVLESTSTIP